MEAFTTHTGKLALLNRANVDTDQIIPKQFLKSIRRTGFGENLFYDWRYLPDGKPNPDFPLNQPRFKGASILVVRNNFGCGSSREHAPIALKAAGLAGVIAGSFARIFYRNAFNMGLAIFECPEATAQIEGGQKISVDMDTGVITDLTTGKKYPSQAIPPFMQELLTDGGLMAFVKKRLEAKSA